MNQKKTLSQKDVRLEEYRSQVFEFDDNSKEIHENRETFQRMQLAKKKDTIDKKKLKLKTFSK